MQNNVRSTTPPSVPCDDKEKLRRRLALLQGEYSRTLKRLKRAERSDALRKHHTQSSDALRKHHTQSSDALRKHHIQSSGNAEQSLRNLGGPTETAGSTSRPKPQVSPSVLAEEEEEEEEAPCGGTAPLRPTSHGQGASGGGPVEPQNGHAVSPLNFPLPSDDGAAALPLTPDPGVGVARGHGGYRSSPALRLRSRSSRLRWEKRWREDGGGPDASGRTAAATSGDAEEEEEDRGRTGGGGGEAEEEANDSECESPSLLLLTHWNAAEEGNSRGRPGATHWSPDTRGQDEDEESQSGTGGKERTGGGGGGGGGRREGERRNVWAQQEENTGTGNTVPGKGFEERSKEEAGGEEGGGLLPDPLTLEEEGGPLFPVEYYVRTTRRMSSSLSRSHPDLQAVTHYQLSPHRGRRAPRGRGGGGGAGGGARRALLHAADRRSRQWGRGDALAASLEERSPLEPEAPPAADDRRSSGDAASVSQTSAGSSSSPGAPSRSAGPARGRGGGGRRGRRGRGRGRGGGKRPGFGRSVSLDGATRLPDQHLLLLPPPPSSPSPLPPPPPPPPSQPSSSGREGPASAPVVLLRSRSPPPPPVTLSPAGQPPCGVEEPTQGPAAASGCVEKIYPIFTKNRPANEQSPQLNRASWWSLLLPPQPSVLPPRPPLSPLLPSGPGLRGLLNVDLQQDFHLPDEQFASLKLHKLRRAAATEAFSSPSYNTRNGGRRKRYSGACAGDRRPAPLSVPLSPTPPVAAENPPDEGDGRRRSTQQRSVVDLRSSPSFSPTLHLTDHRHERENLSDNVVAGDSSDGSAELARGIQSLLVSAGETKDRPPSEAVRSEGHGPSANHQTQGRGRSPFEKSLSRCEQPSQTCNASDRPQESAPAAEQLNSSRLTADTSSPSPRCLVVDGLGGHPVERAPPADHHHHHAPSQLLLSPSLASPPWGGTAGPPSLPLPSLGLTPPPPSLSPPAPLLSPSSTRARSPPPLSPPGPTLSRLLPAPPPLSPRPSTSPSSSSSSSSPSSSSSSPGCCTPISQCRRMEAPASRPPVPGGQPQGSVGALPAVGHRRDDERSQGSAEERVMTCTHTLKTPAGGPLVDACCVWRGGAPGEGECVAVAGKWAVCVWEEQSSTADWSLINTWTFCEPVISVFAVPDAAGLLCVALGQLEIREVRMLSCSGLSQTLLCEGVVHSVVGVANSRVVSSSPSTTGSTLKVFHFSEDDNSAPASQPLVAPGVCVGTLATVDTLSDALIGSAEGGHLFLWNLHSGHLLRRISLGETLSHTVCLNGYSHSGVLFVLLQHQLLNSMEESEEEGGGVVCAEEEEEERGMKKRKKKKTVLFSVVAVNPLTGKSLLATQLYQPEAWSGRLCEADVMGSGVVGLSQNGSVCVWELGGRGGPPGSGHLVWAPEGEEGWQLARWGRQNTLLTGHHNGDLTVYRYRYAVNPPTTTTTP